MRQEFETVSGDFDGNTIKLATVSDGSGQVAATTARVYRTFPWGEEMIRESRGAQLGRGGLIEPDGLALASAWEFYEDVPATNPNYARLKLHSTFDGGWERYTYDTTGRVLTTTRPFLNAPVTTVDERLLRVTANQYGTLPDADGDGVVETHTLTIERTQGRETARRHRIEWSRPVTFDGVACRRRTDVVSVAAGAAWDAAGGLSTETLVYDAGDSKGRPARVSQPDGVAVLTLYRLAANGELTTTVKTGQPNPARTDIVDGRVTSTLTNRAGQVVRETVTDIASQILLSTWTVTTFDVLGRPTRLDYGDGTFVLRTYACCGLASERDRAGILTTYKYDALGRQVEVARDGLITRTLFDAAGRVVGTIRVGTDGSAMTRETSTYDLAGSLTTQSDALGRTTAHAWSYDPNAGELTRTTTQPDGSASVAVFAADGSPLRVDGAAVAPRVYTHGLAPDGALMRDIAVGRDAAGQPTLSEWTETVSDFAGRVIRVSYADGAVERAFFNAAGQRVRQVDPDGVTQLFAYNGRGELEISAVDLNGNGVIDLATDRIVRTTNTVALKSTAVGAIPVQRSTTEAWETDNDATPTVVGISEQSADGTRSWRTARGLTTAVVSVSDGAGGRTVTTTAPDGTQTIQIFSGDRLISTTLKTASGSQLAATTYTYDAHGRMRTSTDARNGATLYAYHADDQIRSVNTPDPDPMRAGAGYDPHTTQYAYDDAGRVQAVTLPDGSSVYTTYWPGGRPKRVWGSRTHPVEYTYDPQGRLETLTTWRDFAADAGRAVTTWLYDPARGFLKSKRHADNTGPSYTYLPSGRLRTRTWARSPAITTTYAYNAAGDPIGADYSDDTPDTAIAYERTGRPKTFADASGLRVFGYHPTGQLQSETYSTGLLAGQGINRSFDALQRLSALAVTALTPVSYTYDAASRLQTVTSGTNTATYAYAANSTLVETLTLASGGAPRLVHTRAYDALNRTSTVNSLPSASPASAQNYTYNAADQRTRATRENGEAWSYTYDPLGQVTGAKKLLADNTIALGRDYAWTFDDIGNRKTAAANRATSTYQPNALNQYAQRTTPGIIDVVGAAGAGATVTVAVDQGLPQTATRQGELFHHEVVVDNATGGKNVALKITGVANLAGPEGQDAVTEVATSVFVASAQEVFAFDADGNLTADARWLYRWDGENRLVGMETSPTAAAAGAARVKLAFSYDGQGRRVAKQVFRSENNGWALASHTLFVYDGWSMIAELDARAGNKVLRAYLWGLDLSGSPQGAGGVGGLLGIMDTATSATHFAHHDGNGNVAGLIAASDGRPSATYDYNPFGEPAVSEGSYAPTNPFRFSTKFTDPETGHLYYGHRYYAPELGRWLSRDPIEEEGGVNIYGFVDNAPTAWIDPLGLALYAFDGTNNDGYRDYPKGKETNVFALFRNYTGENRSYLPGVGTNDGLMNLFGLAFGAGGQARESRMLAQAEEFIKRGDLVVDIIGFSRGAVQTRDFANKLKEKFPCVKIRWIGLFDSVASQGIPNDVNIGYNLSIPAGTDSVLHLTAGAERRSRTFALSSIRPGPGLPNPNPNYREEEMPDAVHSDVGGSYGNNRGLANQALQRMWRDGLNNGVPFGPLSIRYTNVRPNGPNDSRWFNDKLVEFLTGGHRVRKIYFHP